MKARILVAEGNVERRKELERLLTDEYDVEVVSDYNGVVDRLRQTQPDLILADVEDPVRGTTLLKDLKSVEDPLSVPVILLYERDRESALEALCGGAADYLPKLVDDDELKTRIEAHIRRSQLWRETVRMCRESEVGLRSLFSAITDVVLVLDAAGRYVKVAPTNPSLLYRSSEELLGRTLHEVFPREQADAFLSRIREALTRQEVTGFEYDLQIGGKQMWFSATVSPICESHVLLIARDITPRKRAEEELKTLNASLEERVHQRTVQLRRLALELTQAEQRERRRLAQVLHDHIQQLLVGAKMGVQVACRQVSDDKQALDHVSELIDEAIASSKSLTVELSPPILYDAGLIPALHWLSRWIHQKHGINVRLKATCELAPDSEGIYIMLFQAVRELLLNVAKHSGTNEAVVRVDRVEDGSLLRVEVEDNGAGFDPERLKRDVPAGLGLFSIRERIEFVGGRMGIDSAPGMGTRISLTVPFQEAAQPAALKHRRVEMTRAISGACPNRRISVLVVDDHRIVREGLHTLLEEDPEIQIVGEAENGEEAVEMTRALLPDVVIMDVSLPRISGVEATRRIGNEGLSSKVIGLSMYEAEDGGSAMIQAGAVAYLNKAGPAEALIDAIKRA